jgi:DNA-directed RNA polymerase subunit RPC12/RpoP
MDTPIVPRASSAPSPGTIVRCWDCREHFALDALSLPEATGEYACPPCEAASLRWHMAANSHLTFDDGWAR